MASRALTPCLRFDRRVSCQRSSRLSVIGRTGRPVRGMRNDHMTTNGNERAIPVFSVVSGESADTSLARLTADGLCKRLARRTDVDVAKYREQCRAELAVITQLGLADYFLMAWECVDCARRRGIRVGPGRGSSVGSAVAWALGVTAIDPIHFHLLFERFINPEGTAIPEFAIDVCARRHTEVVEHFPRRPGSEHIGAVMSIPGADADARSSIMLVADRPLTEIGSCARKDVDHLVAPVTAREAERLGRFRLELHPLETLTLGQGVVDRVNATRADCDRFDIDTIPTDDAEVFAMLARGDAENVFQLDSSGCRELLMKVEPRCLEDLNAMIALYRPGPLESGMTDEFIERRHGRMPRRVLHPVMEPVLADTYGLVVYQEQVMQIAHVVAGYTLAQADLLRRALGKKKPAELAVERPRFVAGALQNGVGVHVAHDILDLLALYAGYGFNRAHSAAYGWLTYQTAYLKRHFPEEFVALLNENAG